MARTGRYLLDTNIVIALFANETSVQQRLAEASEVFVPSIVVGELYYGAYKSARVEAHLARLDTFVASNTILPCGTATARQYGAIKNTLPDFFVSLSEEPTTQRNRMGPMKVFEI